MQNNFSNSYWNWNPFKDYPMARRLKRHIIYLHGPPNTGKTFRAMEEFKKASSAIYCAPLRLMAQENWKKCVEDNDSTSSLECDLVTGEDVKIFRVDVYSSHLCCTVHCADLDHDYEVAILDEIQGISSEDRGFAYTRALIGLRAKKIIVCGDNSALDLIRYMARELGDTFREESLRKMSDVKIDKSLDGQISNVREGDCIVCFQRRDIYRMQRMLVQQNKYKVAVIYGSLPPEIKVKQAEAFNKRTVPVLISTDAIGMGLNFDIKRIVFFALKKPSKMWLDEDEEGNFIGGTNDGTRMVKKLEELLPETVQQIAGRAGRFNKNEPGLVTTFQSEDLKLLEDLMSKTPDKCQRAGVLPRARHLIEFCRATRQPIDRVDLADILTQFRSDRCRIDKRSFFKCDMSEKIMMARLVSSLKFGLEDKYRFCIAPMRSKRKNIKELFFKLAESYANKKPIKIDSFMTMIGYDENTKVKHMRDFGQREFWFSAISMYQWLSNNAMDRDMFPDNEAVSKLEAGVIQELSESLDTLDSIEYRNETSSDQVESSNQRERRNDYNSNNNIRFNFTPRTGQVYRGRGSNTNRHTSPPLKLHTRGGLSANSTRRSTEDLDSVEDYSNQQSHNRNSNNSPYSSNRFSGNRGGARENFRGRGGESSIRGNSRTAQQSNGVCTNGLSRGNHTRGGQNSGFRNYDNRDSTNRKNDDSIMKQATYNSNRDVEEGKKYDFIERGFNKSTVEALLKDVDKSLENGGQCSNGSFRHESKHNNLLNFPKPLINQRVGAAHCNGHRETQSNFDMNRNRNDDNDGVSISSMRSDSHKQPKENLISDYFKKFQSKFNQSNHHEGMNGYVSADICSESKSTDLVDDSITTSPRSSTSQVNNKQPNQQVEEYCDRSARVCDEPVSLDSVDDSSIIPARSTSQVNNYLKNFTATFKQSNQQDEEDCDRSANMCDKPVSHDLVDETLNNIACEE